MNRDRIRIRRLAVDTVIGVHDWERHVRQRLYLDLDMAVDASTAAASDALEDALDYQAVSERLAELAAASSFQLIETLAEVMARQLLEEFGLTWLRLELSKPAALPGTTVVSVAIERSRDDG